MRRYWLAALDIAGLVALTGFAMADVGIRIVICNGYQRFQTQHINETWYQRSTSMSLECDFCGRIIEIVPRVR